MIIVFYITSSKARVWNLSWVINIIFAIPFCQIEQITNYFERNINNIVPGSDITNMFKLKIIITNHMLGSLFIYIYIYILIILFWYFFPLLIVLLHSSYFIYIVTKNDYMRMWYCKKIFNTSMKSFYQNNKCKKRTLLKAVSANK